VLPVVGEETTGGGPDVTFTGGPGGVIWLWSRGAFCCPFMSRKSAWLMTFTVVYWDL